MGGKGKPEHHLSFFRLLPNRKYMVRIFYLILWHKDFYLDQNNIESFHNVKIENKHFT